MTYRQKMHTSIIKQNFSLVIERLAAPKAPSYICISDNENTYVLVRF